MPFELKRIKQIKEIQPLLTCFVRQAKRDIKSKSNFESKSNPTVQSPVPTKNTRKEKFSFQTNFKDQFSRKNKSYHRSSSSSDDSDDSDNSDSDEFQF